MPLYIQKDEATAAKRRVYFYLVDGTDGLTPETGEAGGQPQISTNGAAWTNTGIGVLSAIGNGHYYAELTAGAVGTGGDRILTRYKSANTAEAPGDTVHVTTFDLTTLTNATFIDAIWTELVADHSGTAGSMAEALSNATAPTAAAVADAVWDEAIADHVSSGSTGETLNSLVSSAVLSNNSARVYESKVLRRQKVRYNNANTETPITYQRILKGAKVTPSAVTVSVFAPGSTTALVSAQAMTITGTLATYSIDTTTTASWPVAEGYRAHITATINAVDYEDDILFDVAKHILVLDVGMDQLVAMDDRVAPMVHNGDEDFSELIEAIRDELHLRIETSLIGHDRLLDTMFLDKSRVSLCARYRILSQIFETKQNYEAADRYMEKFETLWRNMMSAPSIDKGQDLTEDTSPKSARNIRISY